MPDIEKTITIDVDVTVECNECGSDLHLCGTEVDSWGDIKAIVEPCNCGEDSDE